MSISREKLASLDEDSKKFATKSTAMPGKAVTASLNIYTFNILFSYGYTNVFELGPLIDIKKSALPVEGSLVSKAK
ncbi:MAG: hypothetical protein HYY23_13315 [Verrucomicrobia bacterium]|nr:hypothetical protein [Verrucomicrobiota bacterium]